MRPTVGFALCGSFCTFRKAIDALRALTAQYTVVPIFSDAAWEADTASARRRISGRRSRRCAARSRCTRWRRSSRSARSACSIC